MPTWVVVISTIFSGSLILLGLASFPYVAMFFGVHDNERHSSKGKLIVALLLLFIPISIASLYMAWTSNSMLAIVPLIYCIFVWKIRPNKDAGKALNQYESLQQNIDARLNQLEYSWDEWSSDVSETGGEKFILYKFFSSDKEQLERFKADLEESEELVGACELTPLNNKSILLNARIILADMNKTLVIACNKRIIEKAWGYDCEVQSHSIHQEPKDT